MKISEINTRQGMMCLFKSPPKCGKTTAIASFPEPIGIIDADLRIDSVANHPILSKRDIDVFQLSNFQDIHEKLREWMDNCPFQTVALDSLTSAARYVQNYIFENRGNATGGAKRKEEKIGKVGIINLMDIADYSGETSALAELTTMLRVIHNRYHINVILTAHVITSESQNLEGRTIVHRRLLTGGNRIAAEIPSYFNEIYHFEVAAPVASNEQAKYICNVLPTGIDFAGTSFPNMPSSFDWTDKLFYDELQRYIPEVVK